MRPKDREAMKRARIRAGYTQRNLAALCSCTQAAISGLETGAQLNASEDLAKQICKWLDRDMEDLFEKRPGSRMERVTNAAGFKRPVAPEQTKRAAAGKLVLA